MSPSIIPVECFNLIVFGGTGDLARRKLLPALYHRDHDDQMPKESRIIGVSRSEIAREDYAEQIEQAIREHVPEDQIDEARLARFLGRLHHATLDAKDDAGWPELAATLSGQDDRIRVFYLATAPGLFGDICRKIGEHDLNTPKSRVVLEKPIGRDLASAKAINDAVGEVFAEDQIYRIDHYLGKETVQNLMVLRFANTLFEPLWNSSNIDHVQITVAESIGVEGRGGYYDRSGAMRDMVQNHIIQLLCLVAMEPPTSLTADAVGGDRQSRTETFVVLKAEVENWRWAGVPFYLRTGKRLPTRASEIVIQFRPIPHSIFPVDADKIAANQLVVRLQPDEGMTLSLMAKNPGPGGMRLRPAPLNLSFAEAFKVRYADAYERLLMDVVRGNPTLFMRRDEVEAAWSWIEPVIDAWNEKREPPKPYTASTWGPSAAIALIERDGRTWYEDAA